MKRVIVTLIILAALTAGAVYACPPAAVSYSRVGVGHVGYSVGAAYSYAPTVSVVNPYTPTVSLPASYAAPVAAAAPCVCTQAPVAAPAAYESQQTVAAPVASYAAVAAPVASYAAVAAPAYAVGVGHVGYSHVRVGVGHYVGAGRVAVVRAAPVRVQVVQQRRGLLGRLADRIRARRGR